MKKNLVYYFILSASQVLLPLVSVPYVSRVLDPSGVGRVTFIDSLVYFFSIIAEFGVASYGIREVAKLKDRPGQLNKLIPELLVLHLFTTLATLVLYLGTIYLVYDKVADIRLVVFSVVFLLVNAISCEWYFYGTERFRYISVRSVLIRLTAIACIFIFVRESTDYYLYYVILVSAVAMLAALNILALLRSQRLTFRNLRWSRHVRHTWITFLISLLTSVFVYLDNVMLGVLTTAYMVGLYVFAMRIVRVSGSLITDTLQVFFPAIVSLIRMDNTEKLQLTLLRCIQLITTFSVPLMTGTFLLADEIVGIILGPSFAASADNLRILAFYPFLRAHNLFFGRQVLMAHDYERYMLRSLACGSVILVALIVLLAGKWGGIGVSSAVLLAEMVMLLMNYSYAVKCVPGMRLVDWKCFYQSVLSSLLFVPIIMLVSRTFTESWLVLIVAFVACLLVYAICQLFIFQNTILMALRRSGLKFIYRLMEGSA